MIHSRSFMDHKASKMHHSAWRMGAVLTEHVKVFQIETTLNNDIFGGPLEFLQKREWEWSIKDQASMLAPSGAGRRAEQAAAQDLHRRPLELRADRDQRQDRAGAREDDRDRTASTWSRCRASPTSRSWACRSSARTT